MLNKISVLSLVPRKQLIKKITKLIPVLLIFTGFICLIFVIQPITSYFLRQLVFPEKQLINPLDSSVYPVPIIANLRSGKSSNFNQAADWFVKKIPLPSPAVSPVSFFSLSLPGVGINQTPIHINGQDLKKYAIHYPGTSLPGEFGNVVIFGHSALPQFYRPNDPLTIFNPLLQAKLGDQIIINYNDFEYIYKITKIAEVEADQIEVLAQDYSLHEATLITCVPLGTYWHRLVVRAELIN